ncbi:MAG: hypothetical protein AABZ61_00410, partial [Bacteroidota bacterium]
LRVSMQSWSQLISRDSFILGHLKHKPRLHEIAYGLSIEPTHGGACQSNLPAGNIIALEL